MELLSFVKGFEVYLLIFVRMFAMFSTAPFFSSFIIPTRFKILLIILISFIIFPQVNVKISPLIPYDVIELGLMVVNEVLVGLLLGFLIAIVFIVFQMAGQYFSMQMGFGISEVFDPLSQISIPVIGQFQALIGTLVFLYINGDTLLIQGIYRSYYHIPVLDFEKATNLLTQGLIVTFSKMLIVSLQIAFPVIASVFIVTVCLGLLAKFAPQMNIMMFGFPVYIFVGFIVLIFLSRAFVTVGSNFLKEQFEWFFEYIKQLGSV